MDIFAEENFDPCVESDIDDLLLSVMDTEQQIFVPEGWVGSEDA